MLKFVLIFGKSCVAFVWGEKLGCPRTLFIILLLNTSCPETRSVLCCTKSPFLIWELDNTTSYQITIVVTSIACPAIVLSNLLVILAMKTRRELKKTSTILLCSLAVADFLVGALSMPLTITLDALVIQKMPVIDEVFCSISYVNEFLMCTAGVLPFCICWSLPGSGMWLYTNGESTEQSLQHPVSESSQQLPGWHLC